MAPGFYGSLGFLDRGTDDGRRTRGRERQGPIRYALSMKIRTAVALGVFVSTGFGGAAEEDLKARASRIHASAIVVDSHEDVPERLGKEWVDLSARSRTGHVDVPRLKDGGVTAPARSR